MLVANMSGTHKLKPLFINNCWKQHILNQKRINIHQLPVEFHANKAWMTSSLDDKAWMTSSLFSTWLYKQDKIFTRQKRKVALVLANCTAHPNISTLKSIKLIFLPPNTTSVTQSMDQGIIASFKSHYCHHFLQHGLLKAMEADRAFNWTVLDGIAEGHGG